MVSTVTDEMEPPRDRRQRALLVCRISIALYSAAMWSAIARQEPRAMFLAVIVALVPVAFGPSHYRIIGSITAVVTFLLTAVIQLS